MCSRRDPVGGWVHPREGGSWGVGPPVWMCLCRRGCGAQRGRCVSVCAWGCVRCVCLGSYSDPPERPGCVLSQWGLSFHICGTVRGSEASGMRSCPGLACQLTQVFALPEKVLLTSVDPKGQTGWKQCPPAHWDSHSLGAWAQAHCPQQSRAGRAWGHLVVLQQGWAQCPLLQALGPGPAQPPHWANWKARLG